jgi:DNA polymerase-3 subunit epsilon
MEFNLKKDIVFFDVETTGLNVIRDRILQIGLIKYFADGRDPVEKEMLINPGVPISAESMAIHGITPEVVRNKPLFTQLAKEIYEFIGDADLGGYNSSRFDIPMLIEEFARAGFDFDIDDRHLIDVQRIFYKMEPRTLKAAYKLYCNKHLTDAHDALVDVRATVDVLKGQLEKYKDVDFIDGDDNVHEKPIKNDIKALHEFTNDTQVLDVTQRLKINQDGEIVFNFGKYIGQPVKGILRRDRNYSNWILEKDFSHQVKKIVRRIVQEIERER